MSIILTLSVLVTWLTFGVAFCALGGLFFDRIGRIESSWEHLYYSAFVGIALTVLGLVTWHFLFPIGAALGPFAALAAAAIVVERRWFRPLLDVGSHVPLACGALVLVAWTANHSLASGGMDDYNYEFQAVRWFFEHPLIPGLANLHGRLGFNNSHHLLAALMSAGHWAGHVNHILNGFIVALVLVYVLSGLIKVGDARNRPSTVWLFAAVLFAPVLGLVLFGIFGPAISTLKADVLVSAAIILLSCVFLRFAAAQAGTPEYSVSAATVILVGCFLVTVKLSAAAFCAVIVLAVLVRVARDARTSLGEPSSRRLIGSAGAAGILLVCGFLARGIVVSGYPLYPSSAFGLDVDWRVPLAQVEADRIFIKTWSQLRPTYDLGRVAGQEWVTGLAQLARPHSEAQHHPAARAHHRHRAKLHMGSGGAFRRVTRKPLPTPFPLRRRLGAADPVWRIAVRPRCVVHSGAGRSVCVDLLLDTARRDNRVRCAARRPRLE